MIIPELPAYLTSLGGEDYIGLIIALFTLTAGLSRPFSGKLTDRWGRIPVMVFGAVVSAAVALLYPFISSVAGFLLLRFIHGLSTGFKPTGTSAYIADIIPAHRRGEAMGISSFFGSMGMAIGPSIGPIIAATYSIEAMFYASSIFAFLSIAILLGMKETSKEASSFSWSYLKISRREVIEPKVLAPAASLVLLVYSFGVVLTVTPDFSDALEISNKGLFFTVFTVSSMLVRFIGGRASDKYGRVVVLMVSSFFIVISMIVVGFAMDQFTFLLGSFLFGIGVGTGSPTTMAWTIDLSEERFRGKALATTYIALEVGIGLGALASGWIYAGDISRMPYVFGSAALLALLGLIFLAVYRLRSGSRFAQV